MFNKEKGFTLVEVLAALTIMGIVITLALDTLSWQTSIAKRYQDRLETHQAARSAMLLMEKEIRQAKAITLVTLGEIRIIRSNNQIIKFYIADKDFNGVKDLYIETDGVPNPVASYVDEVIFSDKGHGKWDVQIVAKMREVESKWGLTIKQRAY